MPTTCERCLKQPATLACGSLSLCAECAGRALQARKKVKKNKKERDGEQDRPVLIGAAALRALDNEVFCTYYRTQLAPLLAPPEASDDSWWTPIERSLRTPLPVTWRFSGYDESATALRCSMERDLLPPLASSAHMPFALTWYPQRLGWQSGVTRAALRGKDWTGADAPDGCGRPAAVKSLHTWLMQETELGRVQRQELASMVPPLLLDIQPGHAVLDACASPGSKTQQIVEIVGSDGLVIANDADVKRCHMLASRASRLHSPSLVVTNHDARLLPETLGPRTARVAKKAAAAASVMSFIESPFSTKAEYNKWKTQREVEAEAEAEAGAEAEAKAEAAAGQAKSDHPQLRFDRVLADVPCSGDGTLRKNPLIWKRWTASPGNALHPLQLQIACKAVRLLRVGGLLAYSTCSLNPVENEAVVARLLLTFGAGCLELVDVSDRLPTLKRRPGLQSWQVWHRGQFHGSWKSVQQRFWEGCPQIESLFPPRPDEVAAAGFARTEESGGRGGDETMKRGGDDGGVDELHLERCIRLLPHDNDSSGFFVAVFRKRAEHPEGAGVLDPDSPAAAEVCVPDGLAALSAVSGEGGDSGFVGGDEPRGESSSGVGTAGLAAEAAALEHDGAVAKPANRNDPWHAYYDACSRHAGVLHAVGGATVEAAVAAACGSSCAPLFAPSTKVLRALVADFGLLQTPRADGVGRGGGKHEVVQDVGARGDAISGFPLGRLVARSPSGRQLLLVSEAVRALLSSDVGGVLRVVHTGVRIFEREEAKGCLPGGYRACQEAYPTHLLRFQSAQRVDGVEVTEMRRLLECGDGKLLPSESVPVAVPKLHRAIHALAADGRCQPGSVLLSCQPPDGGPPMHFVVLFAPSGAIGPRVKGLERQAMLARLSR